jgi:hypothetical protein
VKANGGRAFTGSAVGDLDIVMRKEHDRWSGREIDIKERAIYKAFSQPGVKLNTVLSGQARPYSWMPRVSTTHSWSYTHADAINVYPAIVIQVVIVYAEPREYVRSYFDLSIVGNTWDGKRLEMNHKDAIVTGQLDVPLTYRSTTMPGLGLEGWAELRRRVDKYRQRGFTPSQSLVHVVWQAFMSSELHGREDQETNNKRRRLVA